MKILKNMFGELIYCYRDENLIAEMGKRKILVRILSTKESGAITAYELVDSPGKSFNPLIENEKNVEEFEILGNQLKLF